MDIEKENLILTNRKMFNNGLDIDKLISICKSYDVEYIDSYVENKECESENSKTDIELNVESFMKSNINFTRPEIINNIMKKREVVPIVKR